MEDFWKENNCEVCSELVISGDCFDRRRVGLFWDGFFRIVEWVYRMEGDVSRCGVYEFG